MSDLSQDDFYYAKYMKYKQKYLELKGGVEFPERIINKVIFVRACSIPWNDENIFKIIQKGEDVNIEYVEKTFAPGENVDKSDFTTKLEKVKKEKNPKIIVNMVALKDHLKKHNQSMYYGCDKTSWLKRVHNIDDACDGKQPTDLSIIKLNKEILIGDSDESIGDSEKSFRSLLSKLNKSQRININCKIDICPKCDKEHPPYDTIFVLKRNQKTLSQTKKYISTGFRYVIDKIY